MRFLANENFPFASITFLRQAGVDVISIGQDYQGITDEQVMNLAILDNRTILTFDRDYGELIFRFGYKPDGGVLYFRWDSFYPQEPGEFLLEIIENPDVSFSRALAVITRSAIRFRKY